MDRNDEADEWISVGGSADWLQQAWAEVPDPNDDVDCVLIASLFAEAAKRNGFPEKQQLASKVVHQWYAVKINADGQVKNPKLTKEYFEKVAKSLNADMEAAGQKLVTCGERADEDPAFDKFAAALGWKPAG